MVTPFAMANVCVYQSRSTISRIAAGMHPLHARPLYRETKKQPYRSMANYR